MSDLPPTPPTVLTDDERQALREILDGCSPEELERVASYVEDLATYREGDWQTSEADVGEVSAGSATEQPETSVERTAPDDDDVPGDVPAKATRTVKMINDNRYYYWQWRDGDAIKSQYTGPADNGGDRD